MQALCFDGELRLRDLPKPVRAAGQALVRVDLAGICNTDIELVKGYMGFQGVLGHEFVGTVAEADRAEWLGKRVCGEINFGCGGCDYCGRGLSRHCPNRTVMGILNQAGAFADFVIVPEENLRRVPDTVPDRAAVFVEPLAAAFEILEQIQIRPSDRVAVVGDGKLGLLICQVLKLAGCNLTLLGKHDEKLAIAIGFGASTVKSGEAENRSFDVVVEASGSPAGFQTAISLLRPRGTLVLKSTYAGDLTLNAAPIVIDEISIAGSRCGLFEPAIRALADGRIVTESLVAATYPFANALRAFQHAQQPGTLKVLLEIHA